MKLIKIVKIILVLIVLIYVVRFAYRTVSLVRADIQTYQQQMNGALHDR